MGTAYVFAFGEMVALLCAGDRPDAAVRLEQLWNSLLAQYHISLHCAYPLPDFVYAAALDAVFQICTIRRTLIWNNGGRSDRAQLQPT
jgi:hypothetical protein